MSLWNRLTATLLGLCFLALCCCPARADTVNFAGHSYTVAVIDLHKQTLNLYWRDAQGQPYKSIAALQQALAQQGQKLTFATNAGIYSTDYKPLGLYIADGKTLSPLNTKKGDGNFYLQPNGVFLIDQRTGAAIVKTNTFKDSATIRLATQSGPLLLDEGRINPAFNDQSLNRKIRSGVGILDPGHIVFVLSDDDVNFYEFARLFKDNFKCRNALFLDGVISRMFIAGSHEDTSGDFTGILAVSVSP